MAGTQNEREYVTARTPEELRIIDAAIKLARGA